MPSAVPKFSRAPSHALLLWPNPVLGPTAMFCARCGELGPRRVPDAKAMCLCDVRLSGLVLESLGGQFCQTMASSGACPYFLSASWTCLTCLENVLMVVPGVLCPCELASMGSGHTERKILSVSSVLPKIQHQLTGLRICVNADESSRIWAWGHNFRKVEQAMLYSEPKSGLVTHELASGLAVLSAEVS